MQVKFEISQYKISPKTILVSDLLKSCKIFLGFSDGVEIHQYLDKNQEPCHFWDFCKSIAVLPYRLHFYLLSTVKDEKKVISSMMKASVN